MKGILLKASVGAGPFLPEAFFQPCQRNAAQQTDPSQTTGRGAGTQRVRLQQNHPQTGTAQPQGDRQPGQAAADYYRVGSTPAPQRRVGALVSLLPIGFFGHGSNLLKALDKGILQPFSPKETEGIQPQKAAL